MTFHLILEEPELDYIGKVLSRQPYADVVALLGKLQQQVNQQQKQAAYEASETAMGPQGAQPLGPNGLDAPAAYTGP